MPATSLAALLVRDGLGLRAAGGGDRDAGDDQDDGEAGGAEQVADAAAAGLGGGGGALGWPGAARAARAWTSTLSGAPSGSFGFCVLAVGGLRQGRRRPIPREAGEAKELRGRRRREADGGRTRRCACSRGRELVDQLARGRDGVQREREQRRRRRRRSAASWQPAAAEQRAAAEELGEHRLAAADGLEAGGGDDPQQRAARGAAARRGRRARRSRTCRPRGSASPRAPKRPLPAVSRQLRTSGPQTNETRSLIDPRRQQRHQHQRAEHQRQAGDQGAHVHSSMIVGRSESFLNRENYGMLADGRAPQSGMNHLEG